jgi:hypothetical protein
VIAKLRKALETSKDPVRNRQAGAGRYSRRWSQDRTAACSTCS